ncbi:MAG: EamA family transporter [Candidatus Cryptobacteroides sp.]
MWLYLALASALFLGLYDIVKKKAVSKNGVLQVLLVATALSTLFLSPFLFKYELSLHSHMLLIGKALIVTTSWISGMIALKLLPITTVSTLKATRPFLVVIFSIILFGERLNLTQWAGVTAALVALFLLSSSHKDEGISFKKNKGLLAMLISIVSGVVSALYDKYIITGMEALSIQSWGNLYITLFLLLCILFERYFDNTERKPFRWDWALVLIAVLITGADALYFFAIKEEGAMLSVVSLLRRCSVLVTFIAGALFFKEKPNFKKISSIMILMLGMFLLLIGSK